MKKMIKMKKIGNNFLLSWFALFLIISLLKFHSFYAFLLPFTEIALVITSILGFVGSRRIYEAIKKIYTKICNRNKCNN